MAGLETDPKVAIGFPGQGPHEPDMIRRLIREFPGVIELFTHAEETLERPLLPLLVKDRSTESTSRENQVRLYLSSCALWLVAEQEGVIHDEGERIFFGASAGEYAALMAAGRIDFPAGLKLIDVRGEEMHKASIINPGGMLIASGLPFEDAEKIADDFEGVYAVNENPGIQTVFAGTRAGLMEMADHIKASEMWHHVRLDWPAIAEAAHSPHMAPAVEGLREALQKTKMRSRSHDFMGNRARLLNSARATKDHLAEQLTRGVLLAESARSLRDDHHVETFIDVGPGKVLYGQMKRQFRKSVEVISIVDELLPEKE